MDLFRSLPRSGCFRLAFGLALLLTGASASPAQNPPVAVPTKVPGKEVLVWADSQQMTKQTSTLRGHVRIVFGDMRLTADEASYDAVSDEVMARGHVIFDDPKSHLVANEVHYNLATQQGWFSNGIGYVHPAAHPRPRVLRTENPFYIWGQTVDRLDEDEYVINHGSMTTCTCAKDGWLLSVKQARVAIGDRLVAHHAVFRFLGVPIFYFPVVIDSIGRTRQTGFLLPNVGNSSQKGLIAGDGFFWAINPSSDLMLGVEEYSKRGIAERGEFRAQTSSNTTFLIDYFGINDKYSATTTQQGSNGQLQTQSLRAAGESIRAYARDDDIGDGFRAVATVDYVNTMAFRLTWSTNYSEAVSSEAVQTGFVSKNWDGFSFNGYAERYENFLSTTSAPGNAVSIRHFPSVQFSSDDREIGDTPFYFSFDTSVDGVGRTTPGVTLPFLSERLDFHPELLLRPKEFWHFRFTPILGFRVTQYGASLEANHAPLDRLLAEFTLDLRPPSLEKVFNKTYHGYRLKHVIEPDIQYHVVRTRDPENILDVIRFDVMDTITDTNEIEYSLTNSILARKDAPDDGSNTPQARDIFSWRIAQKYYFDPGFGGALIPGQNNVFASTIDLTGFAFEHGQRWSPVDSVFKFAPFSNYDTEIQADLSPNGAGGIVDAGITSHIKHKFLGVSVTDFFVNHSSYLGALLPSALAGLPPNSPLPLTAYDALGSVVTFGDPNRKGISGAGGVDYNFQQKIVEHVIGQVSYNFGCFAIDMEYQNFDLGPLRHESQFRVALALANVGTFGNLKPRERLSSTSQYGTADTGNGF